jgi:hypothetical protein
MKTASLLAVLCLLAAVPSVSHAGLKLPSQLVGVNTSARYAFGTLSGARSSPTTDPEFLYCYVRAGGGSADCVALTSANVSGYCLTTNPAIISAISAVGSGSYVYFAWDTANNCTTVQQTIYSYQPTKTN